MKQLAGKQCQLASPLNSWIALFFPLVLGIWKEYLPDDHEKVYSSHSLKWRLGVEPSNVGPAGRGELQHGSFDFPSGGVDVPVRKQQLQWESEEIRKGKNKNPKQEKTNKQKTPLRWLFTTNAPHRKMPFWVNCLCNKGLSLHRGHPRGVRADRHSAEPRSRRARRGLIWWVADERSWEALEATFWSQAWRRRVPARIRLPPLFASQIRAF